jgi:hypothetical protein
MQPVPLIPDDTPVETPFADAASPFKRTEVPVFPGPQQTRLRRTAFQSTWVAYRSQINFGLAMLAYLMVLVGTITVIEANPGAQWRYYMVVLPAIPAAAGLMVFVRALMRLDEKHVRIQLEAFGFALGGTGLITFGYAFLEGTGLPQLAPVYILPLLAILWSVGIVVFTWLHRRR